MRRYAEKRDMNEPDIVKALESIGATVTRISEVGFPDLVVGFRGQTWLIEVKMPKGRLTDKQFEWHSVWRGQVAIVESPDDALRVIGAI